MPAKSTYKRENEILANQLREMRMAAGLTQIECAQALRRPQSYVSNVESGDRRMDLIQLREYCQACGMSLMAFVKKFEATL